MLDHLTSPQGDDLLIDDAGALLLHTDGRYLAYARDVEFMWRWEIYRDGEFLQEGCSLSENSAREATGHVLSHFNRQDTARAAHGAAAEQVQRLLEAAGLASPHLASHGVAAQTCVAAIEEAQ